MIPFNDPRLTAIGLLSEVHAGLTAKTTPALVAAGMSEIDFETLLRLARSPHRRLRMSDLAAQTNLSTSGVTRVVDRLERDDLVRRQACPTDRRASYAVLTDAGAARLEGVLPTHIADIEQWFTGLLTPQQLDQLLEALRIIRDVVRPSATAGAEHVERTEEEVATGAGG
ncbi:DNA-binding MarR family transcriptional regulator [Thermocatellispora tengchongensis]|uniref:DNA-binding MarR family transcriptional regulator n=1 Tax=Thermocatellispora tengchongensis TaxID=1073253 RepID=A0A840NU69_9ACTN|nr:MarR family transcriptional regulator [Thermocatellispora tengchongensis]MBB5130802.1 DNA-binding MarR family transcriptional regulator [Thermocatellispora tengchongensis]